MFCVTTKSSGQTDRPSFVQKYFMRLPAAETYAYQLAQKTGAGAGILPVTINEWLNWTLDRKNAALNKLPDTHISICKIKAEDEAAA